MKEAAVSIYQQYLSGTANPKVIIEDRLMKNLWQRMNSEMVSENWFEEIQASIYCKLQVKNFYNFMSLL